MKITIRETIPHTIKAGVLFFLSIIVSYIISSFTPETANQIVDSVREGSQGTLDTNLTFEAWNIFSHNVSVSITMIILGAILGYLLKFRYGAYILLVINGLVIGIVAYVGLSQFGLIAFLLLTMIHGIIELPTLFFSAGLGVVISTQLAKREFDRDTLISSLKFLIFIIIPLFAISALIEAFVTGGIIVPMIKHIMSLS
jgi:stage II sporulation protein M